MSAGRTSVGMLAHEILITAFNYALPSWERMLPNNRDDDGENAHIERHKVQKKAWRSQCVFQDPQRRLRVMLLCWLGAPVEELMSTLDHFDETEGSNALSDISVDGPMTLTCVCNILLVC